VELALLWKAYRGMANSETTAPEELTALIAQIQEVMSPEQITQISQMSYEDITAVRETLGLEFAFGGRLGTNNQNEEREDGALPDVRQGNFPGGLPQGGFPEGGPGGGPGGGFAGGQGADLDPEQIATLQAERGERAGIGIDRMTLMFLDPLIELLEARAAE
jgi:hypothetical protein